MNTKCHAVREVLGRVTSEKAVAYIRSFNLRLDEETALIDREVKHKSVQQIVMEQNVCPETVKRWRRSALNRIADELNI